MRLRVRTRPRLLLALLLAATVLAGCHRSGTPPAATAHTTSQMATSGVSAAVDAGRAAPAVSAPAPAAPAAATQAADTGRFAKPADASEDHRPVVVFLGDSLAAGHGLPENESFPALIQQRLAKVGSPWRVVNAGVSGDTTAGGLARLSWVLKQRVDVLVLELGGNDGLRGQDPEAMRANLAKIIQRCKARGITVVLAGMQMPANYGPAYTAHFKRVFPELAERYQLPFIPFLLQGVAMQPKLNQADGIHPNATGARIVAENVWRVLKPVLDRVAASEHRRAAHR